MTVLRRDTATARSASRFDGGLAAAQTLARPAAAAVVDPRDERIAALHERVTELTAALAADREGDDRRIAAAIEQGRSEERRAARDDAADRLAALVQGLTDARAALEARFAEAQDAAVAIAEAALARIAGDPALCRKLVRETARHHAATLLAGTVVCLRVSTADFPDTEALASLSGLGHDVVADPGLGAGACVFDLTLGELDASIPSQFAAVSATLARAAEARSS